MSNVTRNTKLINLTQSSIVTTQALKITEADSIAYQLHYTDATPGVKTFVAANVLTNVQSPASSVTIASHGYNTGLKVALSGTNLPTGLSATSYWVIVNNSNNISFADSLAHATAGTKVAITGAGTTSNATLTPALLVTTGVVAKLQQSNDGETFFDVTSMTVTITAAGDTLWLILNPPTVWHRVVITPSTGALTIWVQPAVRNNTIFSPGI